MFAFDERLKGLPASRNQVLALHQSINAPHVAIPGRRAGPAQAFIVGLRRATGVGVFVYLYLSGTQECAVYVPDGHGVPGEDFSAEESDALAFVESMGFIMDNLNFTTLPQEEQDRLLRTVPAFLKDPRQALSAAPKQTSEPKTPQEKLGRLLGLF
ncbi:MAG TPA: social motility and stimulation tgl protein [Myxococcaceae bacterium]|nr:social motility and stimulation tgl protein [Myxococcaceae bacterium]